jgi:hypothetical protein
MKNGVSFHPQYITKKADGINKVVFFKAFLSRLPNRPEYMSLSLISHKICFHKLMSSRLRQ